MILKPQDIGQEGADEPLFKVEFSSEDDRISWGVLIVGGAIAALLYALGATLPVAGLAGVAFAVAIITVILFAFLRAKLTSKSLSEEEIDRKIETFKQDLVDTYKGYAVEYSTDEILESADAYRAQLTSEHNETQDAEIESAADIVKLMGKDIIESHAKKKEMKEARKEEKKRRKGE